MFPLTELLKKIVIRLGIFLQIIFILIPLPYIAKDIEDRFTIIDKMYWALHDPSVIDKGLVDKLISPAKAQTSPFSLQTGYYMGNGSDNRQITNIGFQPDLVLVKDNTTVGNDGILWRSSVMTGERTAKFEAEADLTTNAIQSLDATGFTLGTSTDVNASNVPYFWMAFGGSSCDNNGNFCVGSYTGNAGQQAVTTGFQPDLVIVKSSTTNVAALWKSSSMSTTGSNYFINTNQVSGEYLKTFNTDGFNIGNNSAVNANGVTYWFVAFRETPNFMDVGTYSGNATDNRNINSSIDSGLSFEPNLVWTKAASLTTPVTAAFSISENYGDRSFFPTDTASAANNIQLLSPSGGFQVGTTNNVNASGVTYYYVAFGGALDHTANGTFTMANGTYTGTGALQSVSSIGFDPDLVLIKSSSGTNQYAVFKTKLMAADNTAYLAAATTNFSGGISLGTNSFSVGTSTIVNTSGATYQWIAFGNAWKPDTNTGAADFLIGMYIGDGLDNRNITRLPFQPDFISTKRVGSTAGVFRTDTMIGDLSASFATAAETTNYIQSILPNGFQRGNNATVNTSGNIYHYFAFKEGTNFVIGSYTGNGAARDITDVGFQPDLLWVKKATGGTARAGMLTTSQVPVGTSLYFLNTAQVTNRITGLLPAGFSLGTGTEVNENGFLYRYLAWRIPQPGTLFADIVDESGNSISSPGISFSSVQTGFSCQTSTATFGTLTQKIRVTNTTNTPSWSLAIASTNGIASVWDAGTDGYDFNDPSGSPAGCTDGSDVDIRAGQMSFDFSSATITPQPGCSNTGISLGSVASFSQGVIDSIVIVQASASADTHCYWDITGITVTQQIPAEQANGTYNLDMNLTTMVN